LANVDVVAGRLEAKGFLVATGEAFAVVVGGGFAAVLAAEDAVGLLKGARLEALLAVGLVVVEAAVERDVVVVLGVVLAVAAEAVVPFL